MSHFDELVGIMARLRGPGGCPWDHEQTLETLRKYLIEETYEVLDAIESQDAEHHCEELGDLLLQVVFQAQIRKEEGSFNIDDVARGISEKMIRRHPHVFGDTQVQDSDDVLKNWEEIKALEKGGAAAAGSAVDGVPSHFPALMRADKIQRKAARVGFDWDGVEPILSKVEEELGELREALAGGNEDAVRDELGDLLFAVVNVSRFLRHDPEELLRQATNKFIRRFQGVELLACERSLDLSEMSLESLNELWDEVKRDESLN